MTALRKLRRLDDEFQYRSYGVQLRSDMPLRELVPGGDGHDVRIQLASIDPPECVKCGIHRQGIEAEFGGDAENAYLRWPGVATTLSQGGKTLLVDPDPNLTDANLLNLYVLSEAFGCVLHQRGRFLLHGSAVRIGDTAAVFVGPPGAGKSTTAAAFSQAGHACLGDDMVAIDLDDGQALVLPGYPQIKVSPDVIAGLGYDKSLRPLFRGAIKRVVQTAGIFHDQPVPLSHVFFLQRGSERQMLQTEEAEAILLLTRYFPCPSDLVQGEGSRRHFEQCRQLLSRCSSFRLQLPESFDGLRKAVGEIAHIMQSPHTGFADFGRQDAQPAPAAPATPSPRRLLLADLLAPHSTQEFFRDHWEKQPLFISRHDPHYYDAVLTADDIDLFFQNETIPAESIRIVKEGKEIDRKRWSRNAAQPSVDNNSLFDFFADGATLIINGAERSIKNLTDFRNEIEYELKFRLQFNVYITPNGARGFLDHYDDHDVFILHVHGTKQWRVYGSPVELPSKRQKHEPGKYQAGEPELELEMRPGDLLYIPRGFIHEATTQDSSAIHITFGMHPFCWYELFHELAIIAQDDPAFRKSLPHGLSDQADRQSFKKAFSDLLRAHIDAVDLDDLLDRKFTEFMRGQGTEDTNRFKDLTRLSQLGLDSILSRRQNIVFRIDREDGNCVVKFYGKSLKFPAFLQPCVRLMLESPSFAVRDIHGLIDDAGRVELASTLVREGILRIDALNA